LYNFIGQKPHFFCISPIISVYILLRDMDTMPSKFGVDDMLICSCGKIFQNRRAFKSHLTHTIQGIHFPTG